MSTPMPAPDLPPTETTMVRGRPSVTVAVYETYAGAQRAVDFLSDSKFPVEHVSIVGTDLRLVENVLGRWTVPRAAGAGALTGAWFGLLVGLLLSIFSDSGWFVIIIVAIVIGAVWGAIFGAVAQSATRRAARLHLAEHAAGVAVRGHGAGRPGGRGVARHQRSRVRLTLAAPPPAPPSARPAPPAVSRGTLLALSAQ